jgi:hypothetical protein
MTQAAVPRKLEGDARDNASDDNDVGRDIINTAARYSVGGAISRDRAAVVVTGILQIVTLTPKKQPRPQLEDFLREEFADIARQAAADRDLAD